MYQIVTALDKIIFSLQQELGNLAKTDPLRRECSLVFDSMHLKKKIQMNKAHDTYDGFVDYGPDLELENNQLDTPATEALVFLLVGLTGNIISPL